MTTYFIQMNSGHTQTIEGVKEVFKLEDDYVFCDENDKTITCVPGNNMAFYTAKWDVVEPPGVLGAFK